MARRRISRNRLEGSKNVKTRPGKMYREKMTFNEWMYNLIDRCEFEGADTYVDRENGVLMIRWAPGDVKVRSMEVMYKHYTNDYCSQWEE